MDLIDVQQGRGAVVKDATASMLFVRPDILATLLSRSLSEELFEARLLIEVGAIPMIVERATEEDLAEVEDLLNQCRLNLEAGRPVSDLSARFHSMLTSCVHNSVLQVFMDSVQALLIERGEQLARKPGFSAWELQSHTQVFEAIRARDVARAQAAMREHLEVSAQVLLSLLDETQV
jgi:DNA-binding FadR family transcriptional regulator